MTPRAPRLSTGLSERSVVDRERLTGEAERPRDEGLPDPGAPSTDLVALRRFSRDTDLSAGGAKGLRRFQSLSESRAPAESARSAFGPLAWLRGLYSTWKGGAHGAPLYMGLGFLLGSGKAERVRVEGDVTTLKFPESMKSPLVGLRIPDEGPSPFYDPSASIFIGRSDSQDGSATEAVDLDYFGNPSVNYRHAELFRDGINLYIRDLDSANGTWTWRNRHWSRTEGKHPALLLRGDIVAIGDYPSPREELSELASRNQELPYVILRIESAPETDAVRVRQIQAKSVEHFLLLSITPHSSLFADRRDFPPGHKQWREILGLSLRFGTGKALYRLQVAQRLRGQGHYTAALTEFEAAETALEAALADSRAGKDPWHKALSLLLDLVPDPARAPGEAPGRKELKLHRTLGELYSDKGSMLQATQDPENAAVAFGKAAEHWRYLVGSEATVARQPNFQYELNASIAYRLFFQQAEREYRGSRYVPAALAYEQAARYSEGARRYAQNVVVQKYYPPLRVAAAYQLLTKAARCFLQAGPDMREEYQRVVKKLELLYGARNVVFR